MRTEKVATVQGKTYIHPSEAKELLKVLTLNKNSSIKQAGLFLELIANLKEIAGMDETTNCEING